MLLRKQRQLSITIRRPQRRMMITIMLPRLPPVLLAVLSLLLVLLVMSRIPSALGSISLIMMLQIVLKRAVTMSMPILKSLFLRLRLKSTPNLLTSLPRLTNPRIRFLLIRLRKQSNGPRTMLLRPLLKFKL